jgi:hypothetical protein
MQYTGSSFAQGLVTQWRAVLIPAVSRMTGDRLFPAPGHYATRVPDVVLERALVPVLRGIAWLLSLLRPLQRGSVHAYLLYVSVTLLILLLFK